MKVGVLKLGARLSFESTIGACPVGEAVSLVKMMADAGAECFVFSELIKNESQTPYERVTIINIDEAADCINDFDLDAMIVINGQLNLFGGAENHEAVLPWFLINRFKGKVFYFLCDPELPLKQVWGAVMPERRPTWTRQYKQDDVLITREDITYLVQAYNLDTVKETVLPKHGIKVKKLMQFPFERFPCLRPQQQFNFNPQYDLSYGGTMRSNRREKKMIEYYFGHDPAVKVEMFGKIKLDDFRPNLLSGARPPEFHPPQKYAQMLERLNNSLAHVVIGDPLYEKLNLLGQRVYESIWAGCITFIDKDLDRKQVAFGADKDLADFLYVNKRQDVADRLKLLRDDVNTRKQLVEAQLSATNFNAQKYCQQLVDLIASEL